MCETVLKNLHFFENCNSDSLMVGGQLEREGVVKEKKKKKVQQNSRRQRRNVKSSGERKHDPTNLCPAKLSFEYKGDRLTV